MLFALLVVLSHLAPARAEDAASCSVATATAAYQTGYAAQKARKPDEALKAYDACLAIEPGCVPCLWEKGWSHWSRDQWDDVIAAWTKVQAVKPDHAEAARWLASAQRRKELGENAPKPVPIGTSVSSNGVTLTLAARFQAYRGSPENPADHYDTAVNSPKSVRFSRDGSRAWVNSLEGYETVVYDANSLTKLRTIAHDFDSGNAALFAESPGGKAAGAPFDYTWTHLPGSKDPNTFKGKPVESALSHDDRYLWVPYYRRDFDTNGTAPSAVAIIDTRTDAIVRVLPTGPIPKYVAVSPDSRRVAIAHWGDNTVMLVDTSSGDPATFKILPKLMVVESRLPVNGLGEDVDRDNECGYCLRGTVFTPDGNTLLVSRMGGGGIAGFDVASGGYLGTVTGMKPTPRHLVIPGTGDWLYLSSNTSGYVSRIGVDGIVKALRAAGGKSVPLIGWQEVSVGAGARTIEITRDGRYVFAAINNSAELAVVETASMKVAARVRVDPFTVGLDIAPDGSRVWTTSQGREGIGGNSVCVYDVRLPK